MNYRRSMGTRCGLQYGQRGDGTGTAFGSIAFQAFWISAQATLRKLLLQKVSNVMQSRFTGRWCGWRRTLVRVASGVVCVDLCQVISLSSLYTALPIFLLSSQLQSCYSTGNQTCNLALRTSVLPGPKE